VRHASPWTPLLLLVIGCSDATPGADGGVDATVEAGAGDGQAYCAPLTPDGSFARDGTCPVARPAKEDLVDEALKKIKLDRCKAIFSESEKRIFGAAYDRIWRDAFRLPWYDPVHSAAFNAPPFARQVVQRVDQAAADQRPVTAALMLATHYAGHGGQVCLAPSKVDAGAPLASAVAALIKGAGGTADEAEIKKQAASVPLSLQRALVPVVDAIAAAARARDEALKDADLGKTSSSPGVTLDTLYTVAASLAIRTKSGKGFDSSLQAGESWVKTLLAGKTRGFKYELLYRAAVRLAAAVEGAGLARFAGESASFNVDTPLGRIILAGPQKHSYDPADARTGAAIALLLDTGGDDTYRIPAGATASARNPVSVLVDLGGKDSYGYKQVPSSYDGKRLVSDADGRQAGTTGTLTGPVSLSEQSRQGAARLGVGLLWDLGQQDDSYTSLRMSQGFGAMGVGVLYDDGGDDVYRGEDGVQGSGVFGIGLLLDGGGNDEYRTYHLSQGFAYVNGVGLLYDAAGNDVYWADPGDPAQGGDPLYYTPQLPGKGNSSFVQGAGFGRRDDARGHYMSGGLGVLRDRAGNDSYTCSVFGQGTGYWFGTGILADAEGDDAYDGLWYVQGSTAHFALSIFTDGKGNDSYNAKLTPNATSIGVGHDFSVSWHLDLGGDDSYRAPGLSLGSGNDNGIGVMVNLGGTDSYTTKGKRTLGGSSINKSAAASARASVINLGVFVDTSGSDTYTIDGKAESRNNSSWTYTSTNTVSTKEWGVGLDGSGTVSLP
jgi:hypothetical protein